MRVHGGRLFFCDTFYDRPGPGLPSLTQSACDLFRGSEVHLNLVGYNLNPEVECAHADVARPMVRKGVSSDLDSSKHELFWQIRPTGIPLAHSGLTGGDDGPEWQRHPHASDELYIAYTLPLLCYLIYSHVPTSKSISRIES
jgi:hypothetical protein